LYGFINDSHAAAPQLTNKPKIAKLAQFSRPDIGRQYTPVLPGSDGVPQIGQDVQGRQQLAKLDGKFWMGRDVALDVHCFPCLVLVRDLLNDFREDDIATLGPTYTCG
jgi:hypothetical protein